MPDYDGHNKSKNVDYKHTFSDDSCIRIEKNWYNDWNEIDSNSLGKEKVVCRFPDGSIFKKSPNQSWPESKFQVLPHTLIDG